MKSAHWPFLLFFGICFVILGAMLRLTFEVAWDSREEMLAARTIAEENRQQIYFLRGKAVTLEREMASAAKWAKIYDANRESSDAAANAQIIELRRAANEAAFTARQNQEAVMKRLGEGKTTP